MPRFTVEENYGAKGVWEPQFESGDRVQIVDRQTLEEFREFWKYVARPTNEQLRFSGTNTTIKSVGFYHGGYIIYVLQDVPGAWLSPTIKPGQTATAVSFECPRDVK